MVQLLARLAAPRGRLEDVLEALQVVMRPAQQARGCRFARIYQEANDRQFLEYIEEWDTADDLRAHLGSVRFTRLLELIEMAAERPVLEFRVISETHGLEYVAESNVGGSPWLTF
jgi:quinol monooxygenase YgiN